MYVKRDRIRSTMKVDRTRARRAEGERVLDAGVISNPKYRMSGHETFPCRYAWLPKAYRALMDSPQAFADEERAMVRLGVGKNMVRAIRFWVQATGVAETKAKGGLRVTDFGRALLSPKDGLDPFLEDRRTLWLLHWKLASQVEEPLFAWDYLVNRWPHPQFVRTDVLAVLQQEAKRLERKISAVTMEQHFDVFLHTYVPTRGRKGEIQEDNLDCPLVEVEFIQRIGDRESAAGGRREAIYGFRRDAKSDVTPEVFSWCLEDFWTRRRSKEQTLSFRDISVAHGSPGQVFKLPETDIRERLEALQHDSDGVFQYQESASVQRVIRKKPADEKQLLHSIYMSGAAHA